MATPPILPFAFGMSIWLIQAVRLERKLLQINIILLVRRSALRLREPAGDFNDRVAYQLQDLHSKTGVDILAHMLERPGLHHNVIADCINRTYNAGDPALQGHIKTMAKRRGFEMSEHAPVPAQLIPSNSALVGGTLFEARKPAATADAAALFAANRELSSDFRCAIMLL